MTTWCRTALCFFLLYLGSLTFAQTKIVGEPLKVKVIKVERMQDDQDGSL